MPDVLEGMDRSEIRPGDGVSVAPLSDGPPVAQQQDYFGFATTERFVLPDKVSYLDLKVLNEGERRKYNNDSNREIKLARGSGDAALRMRPGDDKHNLLKQSIVGWNFTREGRPVPFNTGMLDQFLNLADPSVIDKIEKRVRQLNPWLLSEMTVEQIDEEIANLQDMREVRIREDEGNVTSSDR